MESLRTTINNTIQSCKTEHDRQALHGVLHDALRAIESPGDVIWRMMLEPHQYAVMRTAIEMDVFRHLKSSQMTASDLAAKCKAERLLIVRIMRVLAAMEVVREVDVETYNNGPIGEALTKDSGLEGGLKFMFDLPAQAVVKMPQTLSKTNFRNPSGQPAIFKEAFGSHSHPFSYLGMHPSSLTDFNNLMAGQRYNRLNWFDFFPVQERLLDGFDGGSLLVDVGGAQGFELESFKSRFPDAQGDLVLQDLPETIDSITELDSSITRMKHDFFTPQPVQSARAYYFRSIFHDWPDDRCREILRNLRPAMKVGYSKVLINDWVIPDKGAALYPSLLDINMMTLFSSMERSESQWRELLKSEGFEIVKFWSVPGTEGCIEAVVKG